MKTKKNLVKQVLMSILTAVTVFGMTACNDDTIESGSYADEISTGSNELTNLEQYSYAVPVQVGAEGRWKAELTFENEDFQFCYLNQSEGNGPAFIKLCVLDNWTDKRNNGKLRIIDLDNPEKSKEYTLRQKCNLDNPDMLRMRTRGDDTTTATAEEETGKNKGEIVTCVGYGYNVNRKPGTGAISSRPIIALELLKEAGNGYGNTFRKGEYSINVESYTGNSLTEITNTMSLSCSLKGSKGGFSAEADATFTNTQKSNTNNLYCLTIANVNIGEAVLQGVDRNNVRDYMTPDAKKAIDGTGKAYPSTRQGFKDLIGDFGSHLILRTDLGGRLRYGATIDKQFCSNVNELKAHASMSYKNKVMEMSAKASDEYKSTYEKNKNHILKGVSAAGGGYEETAAVACEDDDKNVNAWIQSLKDEQNLAVINLNQNNSQQMWPLYELVDRSTPEGQKRYNDLKQYMESGQMNVDFQEGAVDDVESNFVRIDFPQDWLSKADGKHSNFDGSLIREVRHDGKTVAWVCMEYIPQISNQGLVPVVYPVIKNKPNFQAGHFLGTANKKARDISWLANGTIEPKNYAEYEGLQTTVYVYDNCIQTTVDGKATQGEYRDLVMKSEKMNSNVSITLGLATHDFWKGLTRDESWIGKDKTTAYNYPVVKVGNQVWTRENFNGKIPHGGSVKNRYGTKVETGQVYFTYESLKNTSIPHGWHVAKAAEYEGLQATMTSDGVTAEFGARIQEGGASGFELKWTGWHVFELQIIDNLLSDDAYFYYNYESKGHGTAAEFLLPGKGHVAVRQNGLTARPNEKDDWCMQVRLAMDL